MVYAGGIQETLLHKLHVGERRKRAGGGGGAQSGRQGLTEKKKGVRDDNNGIRERRARADEYKRESETSEGKVIKKRSHKGRLESIKDRGGGGVNGELAVLYRSLNISEKSAPAKPEGKSGGSREDDVSSLIDSERGQK